MRILTKKGTLTELVFDDVWARSQEAKRLAPLTNSDSC